MKKPVSILFLVLVTIFLGFYRDAVFIPINEKIKNGADLNALKWILTGIFTIAYMAITVILLFILYKSIKYVLIALSVYAFILIVSFLISLVGYVFFSFQAVYPFIRTIMGVAQSPVIAMVLIAICYIDKFDK